MAIKPNELLEKMQKFSYGNWRNAEILDLTKADKTPQFEQDAENCWLYSMFNNAYYNFNGDFTLADVIEIKNKMKADGVNITGWCGSPVSGAYIAEYLTNKRDTNIKHFQIDFLKDPRGFINLLKAGYCLEMSRFNTPLLYVDAHDNGQVDQIYSPSQATGWHSVNICIEGNKIKELGTRSKGSKNNMFYYEPYFFGNNIKARAISPIFTFLAELK